jgi:hypothetical protein
VQCCHVLPYGVTVSIEVYNATLGILRWAWRTPKSNSTSVAPPSRASNCLDGDSDAGRPQWTDSLGALEALDDRTHSGLGKGTSTKDVNTSVGAMVGSCAFVSDVPWRGALLTVRR